MKKKIVITLIAIISISIFIITLSSNNKKYINMDGIKLAISDGNGGSLSTVPAKGMYKVTVNCKNAVGSWDYINWKIIVKNISGDVKCNLTFKSISTTYLNTYITSLSGTTQGTGQVVNENGYRYEGKNPNNYIWFNDELWRIIGVFDSASHGQSGKNLVKIIRADSIGGLAWDKSYTSDWVNSSLKALLNGAYYDWDTNSASAATNCYGYSTTVSTTCDYSKKGIQDGYRSMIENVTWYLGGGGKSGYTTYTPNNVYGYERNSEAIYSGRSSSTTGYIGLMYESDYLYGVLASSCARTTAHGSYSTAACAGNNWLYGTSDEWTITPNSNSSGSVWNVYNNGSITWPNTRNGSAVRPVLYLGSTVYKYDGDGTIDNPYIIGM